MVYSLIELERKRREAFARQDAQGFYEVNSELGMPDDSYLGERFEADNRYYESLGGLEEFVVDAHEKESEEANKGSESVMNRRGIGRKISRFDYRAFHEGIKRYPNLSLQKFEHIETKRELLITGGYYFLYSQGGKKVPIARASDGMVNSVFVKQYNALQKRLGSNADVYA